MTALTNKNLRIVARNLAPQKQHTCPQAWVLYSKQTSPVRMIVIHDAENHPRVISREAA